MALSRVRHCSYRVAWLRLPPLAVALAGALVVGCSCSEPEGVDRSGGGPSESRIVWHHPEIGAQIAPSVDDSIALFVSESHEIVALDKRTGEPRWRNRSGNSGYTPGKALLIVGPNVLFPDYELYAFDRRDGSLRWVFRDGPDGGPGYSTLATDSLRVFAGSVTGDVYAIDALSGRLLWKSGVATDTSYTRVQNPVIDSGLLVVTYYRTRTRTGGVAAMDAGTGALRWQRELLPESPTQPAGSVGRAAFFRALVIVAAEDGRIYALDRVTGAAVWTTPRPAGLRSTQGDSRRLVVSGHLVVVGSTLELMTALDAATGVPLWEVNLRRGSLLDPMTEKDGIVYLSFISGQLAALEPATGRILFETARSDSLFFWTYPAVDSNTLYGSAEHGFYALRR